MFLRLIFILWAFAAMVQPACAQTADNALPKTDEITLETNVVEIILNDEHRNGLDWGAIVSDFHTAVLKKENDPVWADKSYRVSFGTLSQDDYSVLLDALEVAGRVTQTPQGTLKLTAGQPSSIQLDKQNMKIEFSLERLKSGELSLLMTPQLTLPATEIINGQKVPASVVLQAQTSTNISNNLTLVIGGYMKEEEIKRTRKVPLLGDIPLVGLVFRSRGHLMQKTETVIFITVRTNAVNLPSAEAEQ